MRAWLEERSAQEKVILAIGVAVVLGAIYFLFLIDPLVQSNERLAVRVQGERQLNAHLADVRRTVNGLGATGQTAIPAPVAPGQLVSVLTSTAQAAGVQTYTRRMTPLGPNALSVFVEGAPFTSLAAWLLQLRNEHGVEVEQAAISAHTVPGLVDAQLTLRTRGS